MKFRKTVLILAVLILAVPILAAARSGPPMHRGEGRMAQGMGPMGDGPLGGPFWKNEDMVRRLGLSADQVAALEALEDTLPDRDARRDQCDELRDAMKTGLDANDAAAVRAAAEQLATLHAQGIREKAEFELAVRNILTQEQWEQLTSMRPGPNGPRGEGPQRGFRGR